MDGDALLEAARRGDRQSLERLLILHQSACYGFALRLTRHAPDAEDICQDAFLRAAREIAGLRLTVGARAWLLRIVLRTYQNRRQSETSRRNRERRHGMDQTLDQTATDPAEQRELREHLEAGLCALDDTQRRAIALHYEQGLSRSEVAEVLEIPEGTVASRLRRGIEFLRAHLAGAGLTGSASLMIGILQSTPPVAVPAQLTAAIPGIVHTASAAPVAGGVLAAAKLKAAGLVLAASALVGVTVAAWPAARPPAAAATVAEVVETGGEEKVTPPPVIPASTVTGVVVDKDTGAPVSGIRVFLRNDGFMPCSPVPGDPVNDGQPTTLTDALGRYTLRIQTASRSRIAGLLIYTRSETHESASTSTAVYQGETVTLPPLRIEPCAMEKGRLTGPGNVPVAGARIRSSGDKEYVSGADGTFVDSQLPSTQIIWSIVAPGFENKEVRVWRRSPWFHVEKNPEPMDVRLVPCRPVTGEVVEEDGTPATDVRVFAGQYPSLQHLPNWSVPVDGAGRFVMDTSPPQGRPMWIFAVRGKTIVAMPLPVQPGDTDRTLIMFPTGSVTATVTDAAGHALAGVDVRTSQQQDGADVRMRWGTTDAEGRAVIADVPVGSTIVEVLTFPGAGPVHGKERPRVQVSVEKGRTAAAGKLACPPKMDVPAIRGVLLDKKGNPVRHASITVCRTGADAKGDWSYPEWTEVDGRFEVPVIPMPKVGSRGFRDDPNPPTAPEKVRMLVSFEGYQGYALEFNGDWPAATKDLDAGALTPNWAPERILVIRSDRPWTTPVRATVHGCIDPRERPVPFRWIDTPTPDEIRVGVRNAGELTLWIDDPFGHRVNVPVPASTDAGEQPMVVEFPAPRRLELATLDEKGDPFQGMCVYVTLAGQPWPLQLHTNAGGMITIDIAQEASGKCTAFRTLGHQPEVVEIAPGAETIRRTISLRRSESVIAGRVTVEGKPAPLVNAHLSVSLPMHTTSVNLELDNDGRFRIQVPSGIDVSLSADIQTRKGQLSGHTDTVTTLKGAETVLNLDLRPEKPKAPPDPEPGRREEPSKLEF